MTTGQQDLTESMNLYKTTKPTRQDSIQFLSEVDSLENNVDCEFGVGRPFAITHRPTLQDFIQEPHISEINEIGLGGLTPQRNFLGGWQYFSQEQSPATFRLQVHQPFVSAPLFKTDSMTMNHQAVHDSSTTLVQFVHDPQQIKLETSAEDHPPLVLEVGAPIETTQGQQKARRGRPSRLNKCQPSKNQVIRNHSIGNHATKDYVQHKIKKRRGRPPSNAKKLLAVKGAAQPVVAIGHEGFPVKRKVGRPRKIQPQL